MEGGVKDDNDGIGDAQGVGLFYANRLRLVGVWFNASRLHESKAFTDADSFPAGLGIAGLACDG